MATFLPYLTVTLFNTFMDFGYYSTRTIRYLSEFSPLEIQASHRSAHPAPMQREDNDIDRCVVVVVCELVSPCCKHVHPILHDTLCTVKQGQMMISYLQISHRFVLARSVVALIWTIRMSVVWMLGLAFPEIPTIQFELVWGC